jgi:hypothetical protein
MSDRTQAEVGAEHEGLVVVREDDATGRLEPEVTFKGGGRGGALFGYPKAKMNSTGAELLRSLGLVR